MPSYSYLELVESKKAPVDLIDNFMTKRLSKYNKADKAKIMSLFDDLGYSSKLVSYFESELESVDKDDIEQYIYITSQVSGSLLSQEDEDMTIQAYQSIEVHRLPELVRTLVECKIVNHNVWDQLKLNIFSRIEKQEDEQHVANSLVYLNYAHKFNFW